MSNGGLVIDASGTYPIFSLTGYCTDESMAPLKDNLKALHEKGNQKYIFDFADCMIVNSLGMADLLDAILIIDQDYSGFSVLTGLDAMKETLFTVSGIIPISLVAKDIAEATRLLDQS